METSTRVRMGGEAGRGRGLGPDLASLHIPARPVTSSLSYSSCKMVTVPFMQGQGRATVDGEKEL